MIDEPLALNEEEYRELAAFLEEQLPRCPTGDEKDQLRRRLVRLYSGPLNEPLRAAGHIEELLGGVEALVAKEPGDDELRHRYIEQARSLGAGSRVAETLGRMLKKVKAADVRERVGFDIGSIHRQRGELKQARSAFLEVVLVGAGGPFALSAAHQLLDPELSSGEAQVIATALETVARADQRPAARQEAAEKLLSIHESKPLKESRLFIAYQALVDSARAEEALGWLRTYYERKGDQGALAEVYRRQALRTADPVQARALALRSLESSRTERDEDRIEQWLWFLKEFGPDSRAHASVIPLLERAQRWDDLCRVLEADVELVTPEQRAPAMARVGQIRLVVLADAHGALSAFRRCLSLDPWNELARTAVEGLMSAGDSRLAAAGVLEPVYRVAKFHEGELRVLETRAELLPDPAARLAALAAAVDIAKGKLTDARRAMQLCERALREAFAFASEAVLDWVVRLERVAALSEQPETHAGILLRLLGDGPLDSPERIAVAVSAVDALVAAGAADQAFALCERGLADDPSAPELLARVDALVCDKETPRERVARYEAALHATTVAARRRSLMHTIATLRRESLGDAVGAIAVWRSIVTDDPQDIGAYEALIDTMTKVGDIGGAVDLIDVACRSFRGPTRHQLTLRKALMLVAQGASDRALELCRELVGRPDVPPPVLQGVARLAHDEDDEPLYARALKKLISCDDSDAKRDALERYGEFLSATVGNHSAAAECWRTAAGMRGEDAADQEHARMLYERALQVLPSDVQAASQLIELYARAGDWERIPLALKALIRGDDPDRCVLLLLRLEASAVAARAVDEFVSLVDELRGKLAAASDGAGADVAREAPEHMHALGRARARVLACDPARGSEASQAYRALVEAFESEDDVRDFAGHIEAMEDSDERHHDVRWLYQWRADHAARPSEVLLEWASAEEAHGDSEAAASVYQRLLDAGDERKVALQALVRLQVRVESFVGVEPMAKRLNDLERLARDLGSMEMVARVYHDALVDSTPEPSAAEMLGRRLIAIEEECSLDPSHLIEALYRVLDILPGARWALDRVKVALGAQARYGELFDLFDRAIGAAPDERERAELLYEAAAAARDLAGAPERAIVYFESLRPLRPEDASVEGALERLYERQGRTADLVELLSRRLERASGFRRRDLSRRLASLWLDLGDVQKAGAVVDEMLSGQANVVDVIELLERIVQQPGPPLHRAGRKVAQAAPSVHEHAIDRLRNHYESAGRLGDVLRMAERSFALASPEDERARCIRDLVEVQFRVAVAEGASPVFERVSVRLEAYVGGETRLVKVANRALLMRAVRALRADHPPGERADVADAQDGAWAAIQSLLSVTMDAGDASGALRLLERSARLPLESSRRREILGIAAFVCSEYLRDPERAIGIFTRLFDEDAGDEIAAKSLQRFSTLLDAAGRRAELAALWERQADVRARGGEDAEEAACWQRAAFLWEQQGAIDQAIHAHRRAAAVGGEASFEALARIHAGRDEWSDASRALEWLCAHAPVGAHGPRALRLAHAYAKLGERPRARACLEDTLRIVDETEDTESVRKRLIELYREDEVWAPLARLLSAEAGSVHDPARKLTLLREAADLHRHRLDDPGEAATLLAQAVSLDPLDHVLRASLLDILEMLQQWERMVVILREQIELYGDSRSRDRALTHHRLASTLVRANLREEALRELRLAAEMNPTHPSILYDLARVALDLEEFELSERTYRALLLAVHRPTDGPPSSASRADIFLDLSEIAVRRGELARAADLVDSALDEAVERGDDPERIERGLRARGHRELLARAFERRVQRGTTLTDRATALGDLAQLWSDGLGRPSELGTRIRGYAEQIARDLGHEERTDASAWAALCTAYASFDGKGPLAAILTSAIPRISAGAERSRLRVMLARTLLDEPSRLDAAVDELSKALDEDPSGRESIDLLSQVLEREGRFDRLVTVWERKLRTLSAEAGAHEVVGARWRHARALELAGRVQEAVSTYESLVDRPIEDREIARSLADRLGELSSDRLADALERWMAVDTDSAAKIAKRLASLRGGQGDAAGAIRALELGFSAHPGDAELRDRLIKSYEARAEWDQAVRVLDVAVAARTGDADLLVARSRVRERLSDHEGALDDLERASTIDSAHVNALVELFARISAPADVARGDANTIRLVDVLLRANRPKQARRELERLLARSPNHREALARLASLAAAEGHWKSAAEAHRKLLAMIESSSSPEEVARVAVATADACERAGILGEARESLARVVDVVGKSPNLLLELERLCQAMRDWPRLASTLMARAEREEGAEARADLLLRAGRILLEEANDSEGALPLLDQVRATRPDSVEARLLWARAQVTLGRAPEALKVLYETLERSPNKRATWLAEVYLEIGNAHLAVDELPEALFALESGFAVDWRTGDVAMLLGLVALDLGEERTAERAFSAVTALPLRKGTPSGAGADAAAKATAYCHLAGIAMGKGDLEKARRLAGKALGGEPGHVAARALLERLDSAPVASVS